MCRELEKKIHCAIIRSNRTVGDSMEHSTLEDLLNTLEKKGKIHICVSFQEKYGNVLLAQSAEHRYHKAPVCRYIRKMYDRQQECTHCRTVVERLVVRRKKPIAGCCPNGIYEYCSPVIYQDRVIAVVFVGNILTDSEEQKQRLFAGADHKLLNTMATGYTDEDCRRIADIVGSYIKLLLDVYGTSESGQDPLVERIKHYIFENYTFGFSAADIADAFGYNEKYIGRIFKERAGQSIKAYCNAHRINEAKKLLVATELPISDIASLTGFNNITYFNFVFGKHTAMSPTQYRESVIHHS